MMPADPWSLRPRQREILARLAEHGSNKQAARELGISLRTVEAHLVDAYRRMQAPNRVRAVALWVSWVVTQERKAA